MIYGLWMSVQPDLYLKVLVVEIGFLDGIFCGYEIICSIPCRVSSTLCKCALYMDSCTAIIFQWFLEIVIFEEWLVNVIMMNILVLSKLDKQIIADVYLLRDTCLLDCRMDVRIVSSINEWKSIFSDEINVAET